MDKFIIYLALISTLSIISCSDKEDSLQDTSLEIDDISLEKRSIYECLPVGPCSEGGTGFDLTRIGYNTGWYDLSDCIYPTPVNLCKVTGTMDVWWCDTQMQILEPQIIGLPDCGANATYIDWDCVRETVAGQLEKWLWEFYFENEPNLDQYTDCNFGDEIHTSTIFRNTCSTQCTTIGPWPQSRLIECGDGDAYCYKTNYWCDEGEGLHIYHTEIDSYGECGIASEPGKGCIIEGPCEPRPCFQE